MLRESVVIITTAGELEGELFVGKDGLPELEVTCPATVIGDRIGQIGIPSCTLYYRPATLPCEWGIKSKQTSPGALFLAWCNIDVIREQVRAAQREAQVEPCKQGDGYVSHDFIGEHCIRCGLSDRDRALVCRGAALALLVVLEEWKRVYSWLDNSRPDPIAVARTVRR